MPRPQDPVELVVLSVLAHEPLYGYAITKRIETRSSGELAVGPGVLYPLLKRLERDGLVAATWDAVRSDRAAEEPSPGRRRKWYRLTPKGQRRLHQHIGAHRARVRLIEAFIGPGPAAQEESA
ncbi:MAG: helix-turn-helix transcriptional regulator [Phycisphaeraceae bacterium]|nr:helix-turn-helix transcriptional regulator [Phycisphaeraceae bacterium]